MCTILWGGKPVKDKGSIRRGSYNANLTPVKIEEEERRIGYKESQTGADFF